MSRVAQETERLVREMRAAEARQRRRGAAHNQKEAQVANGEHDEDGQDLGPAEEIWTGDEDPGSQSATEVAETPKQKKERTAVAKKKTAKATKTAKAPAAAKGGAKAAKAPRAAKGGARGPREKKVAKGAITAVVTMGGTYLALEFEEGKIVLTPTSNREQNRDLAVKALKALLKG